MIEHFHFLRPYWLLALIPLIGFLWLMLRRQSGSLSWKNVCDAELLPHILTRENYQSSWPVLSLIALTTVLIIIALAGPVWKKLPQPVFRDQSALVIALDLSQSMNASDLRPSRLTRARLKLLDILEQRKSGQTALIVYADSAFTVTPLTDDVDTIANLVPALETSMMPTQGSQSSDALKLAAELLQQAGVAQGHVLLITDEIPATDFSAIDALRSPGHRLSVLGVGTREGSPVAMNGGFLHDTNGAIVVPKLNEQTLIQAAHKGGGVYVGLQPDDADINRLTALFSSTGLNADAEDTEFSADTWQEQGPWLLLLALPLVAFWSRRGWLLCFVVIILPMPDPAYALQLDQLWQRPDQKAMQAFESNDHARAAELFEQQRWKASALYRAGDYEATLEALKHADTGDDFYNKGNALAQLGRYPEAISAYEEALKLDPDNVDAAYNRKLVEKQLQQDQQQQDQQQQDQQQQDQEAGQKSDQKNEPSQDAASNEDTSSDDSTQDDPSQANDNAQDQPAESSAQQAAQKTAEQDASEDTSEDEDVLATEQWLRKIPDDPGGLLRRKFEYQYKRRQPPSQNPQPW